jgi:hypothetical protein
MSTESTPEVRQLERRRRDAGPDLAASIDAALSFYRRVAATDPAVPVRIYTARLLVDLVLAIPVAPRGCQWEPSGIGCGVTCTCDKVVECKWMQTTFLGMGGTCASNSPVPTEQNSCFKDLEGVSCSPGSSD